MPKVTKFSHVYILWVIRSATNKTSMMILIIFSFDCAIVFSKFWICENCQIGAYVGDVTVSIIS